MTYDPLRLNLICRVYFYPGIQLRCLKLRDGVTAWTNLTSKFVIPTASVVYDRNAHQVLILCAYALR